MRYEKALSSLWKITHREPSMTDEPNIVLEILKGIQSDCAYFRRKFDDIDLRLAALESHAAANHLDAVQLGARLDAIDKRLGRVEQRLELREEMP